MRKKFNRPRRGVFLTEGGVSDSRCGWDDKCADVSEEMESWKVTMALTDSNTTTKNTAGGRDGTTIRRGVGGTTMVCRGSVTTACSTGKFYLLDIPPFDRGAAPISRGHRLADHCPLTCKHGRKR